MGDMDHEPAPLVNPHSMGVGGVRRSHDLGPLVPDRLLSCRAADAMLGP
jgi:hypothetical protein